MNDFSITFQHPWLLLLIIPALLCTLIPFFLIPKKFRRTRNRVISVTLHSLAAALCVTLIAGISFLYTVPNRENELMILVDLSDSGNEQADEKDEYVQTVINLCGEGYKVGVVTFGLEPVYAAPLTYDLRDVYRQYLSAPAPDTSATDIAAALDFAAQQFENPQTSKIVLLSDGLETDSEALSAAELIAARGIKIDTVCFPDEAHGEVQLTDAMQALCKDRGMMAVKIRGKRFDAGNWPEFLSANIYFGLQDENIRYPLIADLKEFLQLE